MAASKKKFPKLKKKLGAFLSDESGKITKQDVAKLSLGAMLIGGVVTSVEAGHENWWNCRVSDQIVDLKLGNVNIGQQVPVEKDMLTKDCNGRMAPGNISGVFSFSANATPYSLFVNGHANNYAKIIGQEFNGINVHVKTIKNYTWHRNHGSGGWC